MKKKIIGAVEVSSCAVKLVIGYVLDGEVIVLNTVVSPLEEGAVLDGDIHDFALVSKTIASTVKEGAQSLPFPVQDWVMVLPPIGFEVYEHSQTTSVVSAVGRIAKLDVENVLSQVSKARTTDGSMIVDILPDAYILDQGQTFPEPPIGQISNSLGIKVKLHVCPIHIVNAYKKVFMQANIRCNKMIVAPYAGLEVVKAEKNIPADFLLIDLGARMTSIHLIGQGSVVASTFMYQGANHIVDKISSTYGLDFKSAQDMMEMYGFDHQSIRFDAPLFSVVNENQKQKNSYTVGHFRQSMESFVQDYVQEIVHSMEELAKQTEDVIMQLPIFFIGGGINLHGLEDVLKEALPNNTIRMITPHAIGARDSRMTNVLGALKIFGMIRPIEDIVEEEKVEVNGKTRKIKMHRESALDDLL